MKRPTDWIQKLYLEKICLIIEGIGYDELMEGPSVVVSVVSSESARAKPKEIARITENDAILFFGAVYQQLPDRERDE